MEDRERTKKQFLRGLKALQLSIAGLRKIRIAPKLTGKILNLQYQQLLSIFDSIDEPIYVSDPVTYEILYANKALKEKFGDVVKKKCYRVFQGLESPCSFCTNERIFDKNVGQTYIWEFQNRINHRWYHCIDKAIRWPDGRMVRYEMAIDITERKQVETMVKTMLNNVAMGISMISPKMEILWLNETFKEWFSDIDIQKKPLCYQSFYSPPRKEICDYCPTIKAFKTGKIHSSETSVCADGKIYNLIATPVEDEKGEICYVVETVEDITERKRAERMLRESEERYRSLFEDSPISLWEEDFSEVKKYIENLHNSGVKDFRRYFYNHPEVVANCANMVKIVDVNRATLKLYKARSKNEFQYNLVKFFTKESYQVFREELIALSEGRTVFESEAINQTMSGDKIHISLKWSVAPGYEETLSKVFVSIVNITDRKRVEEELETLNKELLKSNKRLKQLALRDSHTGLYNHRYLEEAIEAEFHRARRYGCPLSAIMLDIDYFKSINDVYGHQFGDLILKQFARQLKRIVRRYDIVIRYGGEEFIIVSPGVDRYRALILAQRLLNAINLYNFGDKNHIVKLRLSIAVVSYPEDRIIKAMDLINLTDQILNNVKESGGNKVYSSLDINKEDFLILGKPEENPEVKILKDKIEKLTKQTNQSLIEAVFAFAKTIKLKDHYTGEHVESTVNFATEIARGLNLPKNEIERIRQASILHDLGKIGISENILLKKTKLTKREFDEIKKHPQIGVDIIRSVHYLNNIIPLILYHHERFDGKGYLSGLKGEEIPIGARIIAIADVYQALISDRPYRNAYSKEEAIKIIKQGSGSQFDPEVVDIFVKVIK